MAKSNSRETPDTPLLVSRSVSFSYGNRSVLQEVSLDVSAGDRLVVLGANGAGKSTLLRVLAGLLQPTSGAVLLEGRPLAGRHPREIASRVAVVPQLLPAKAPFLVEDMVSFARYPYCPSPKLRRIDREACEAALEAAGIAPLRQRRFEELSGGEQRLVSIACALAQEPALLFLDEPTSFLDPGQCRRILAVLAAAQRERGFGLAFVSHDINAALSLADRIVGLAGGRVVFEERAAAFRGEKRLEELFGERFVRVESCGVSGYFPCSIGDEGWPA